ncbi:MAG: hypothetical protein ACI4UU_03285 [Clostridia bacterium]
MIIFIYLCILALNVVAVLINYRFLGTDIDKKEKLIFIVVGIAIMYVTVSIVYGLSVKNIEETRLVELAKNYMIFTFVPVNTILVLPFFASSYKYLKLGRLKKENFRNRTILLVAILLIILIIEFFYFQDIQTGILNIVQSKQ